MPDIYTAIMKAADQIEDYPNLFHFTSGVVPHTCLSPGCALGWIGFYLGRPENFGDGLYIYSDVAHEHLGMGQQQFYDRMSYMEGERDFWGWSQNADICARRLRMYAAKYHAPVPDSVLDIFKPGAIERQMEEVK